MLADRKPSTQTDQGIENSYPVEVLLGSVRSGSVDHYLYEALGYDGYQIKSFCVGVDDLEFLVKTEDRERVISLLEKVRERPGFKVLSQVLDGHYPAIEEVEGWLSGVSGKMVAEINLVAAGRNSEIQERTGSIAHKFRAWREFMNRSADAKERFGLGFIDAKNHIISLIQEEYEAVKPEALDPDIVLGC